MIKRRATSLVEMLIILALISLLALTTLPFLTNFSLDNNFYSAKSHLITYLREAQLNSMHNKNNTSWGVCLVDDNLRLYSTDCNVPVTKIDYKLPGVVEISGFTNVSFNNIRGEPDQETSIFITTRKDTQEYFINKVGGISEL